MVFPLIFYGFLPSLSKFPHIQVYTVNPCLACLVLSLCFLKLSTGIQMILWEIFININWWTWYVFLWYLNNSKHEWAPLASYLLSTTTFLLNPDKSVIAPLFFKLWLSWYIKWRCFVYQSFRRFNLILLPWWAVQAGTYTRQ